MGLKRLERFFALSKSLHSSTNLKEVAEILIQILHSEIIQADLIGFFIKNTDRLYTGYACDNPAFPMHELKIHVEEDSFAREIIMTKRSRYLPTKEEVAVANRDKVERFNIHSILGIPVLVDDDVFAMIFIHDVGKEMELSDEQVSAAEAFVTMASVAIKNLQMMKQTQYLLNRQQLLLDVTHALSTSNSTRTVVQTCFDFIDKAVGVKDTAIFLYDENEKVLSAYALSSRSHIREKDWFDANKDRIRIAAIKNKIFHEVVVKRKPVLISDVATDPRCNQDTVRICARFNIKAMVLIPLVVNGRVLGVAASPTFKSTREFTSSEIELCQSICEATASTLSNALYAEQLEARVAERTLELQHMNVRLEKMVNELKKVDKMKNDFINSLSHEIRTPLTCIQGSIDLMEMGLVDTLTEKQQHMVTILRNASERLLTQVDELLDFARVEHGTIRLNIESVSIPSLILESIRVLEPTCKRKNQTVKVEGNIPITLQLDKHRISQVLVNLLSNAIKFTPNHGTITVRTLLRGAHVVVEVMDTGVGILSEKKEYIFTKFFQVDAEQAGTGLGLAISKQLIELHNGTIWFSSEKGKGSVFAFELPLSEDTIAVSV